LDAISPIPIRPTTAPNGATAARWFGLRPVECIAMLVVATTVVFASHFRLWPISTTEAWGFATGGICVWLVVREHLWNWPIGLANNCVFFVLFMQSRLYADMGLQVVYFALGLYGWLNWLYGGARRTYLKVTRTTRSEWLALVAFVPLGTWGLREILLIANGAAPFWDALTTILSLAAQYLLCRKRVENWFLWIATDIIYVPLYFSRSLPLTGMLYAVFLVMCLCGLRAWRKTLAASESPA
jgi:nicotinamide mononucleotide transporter